MQLKDCPKCKTRNFVLTWSPNTKKTSWDCLKCGYTEPLRTLDEVEKEIGETIFKLNKIGDEVENKEKDISILKALAIPLESRMRELNDEFHEVLSNNESEKQ